MLCYLLLESLNAEIQVCVGEFSFASGISEYDELWLFKLSLLTFANTLRCHRVRCSVLHVEIIHSNIIRFKSSWILLLHFSEAFIVPRLQESGTGWFSLMPHSPKILLKFDWIISQLFLVHIFRCVIIQWSWIPREPSSWFYSIINWSLRLFNLVC